MQVRRLIHEIGLLSLSPSHFFNWANTDKQIILSCLKNLNDALTLFQMHFLTLCRELEMNSFLTLHRCLLWALVVSLLLLSLLLWPVFLNKFLKVFIGESSNFFFHQLNVIKLRRLHFLAFIIFEFGLILPQMAAIGGRFIGVKSGFSSLIFLKTVKTWRTWKRSSLQVVLLRRVSYCPNGSINFSAILNIELLHLGHLVLLNL